MRKIFILNYLLLWAALGHAQNLGYKEVPISRDGHTLAMPGVGGLETPQYSPIDLNGDGKKDLLVYDRTGEVALPFLNTGSTGQIKYEFAPEYMQRFPQRSANFMLARDYNCDQIEDLIYFYQIPTGGTGISVWRGSRDGQNKIQFNLATEAIHYDFGQFTNESLFIYNPDIPAFEDVDGDGDMDILAFSLDFSFARNVFYYKNMSAENGHGCDSLQFQLFNRCFGQFSESGSNNTVIYSGRTDSCGDNSYWRSPRHLGSSLSMFDHNGDGHKDLFMGDVSVNALNMMTMTSQGDTLVVTQQDSVFPSYGTSVNLLSFPSAYFLDANNDGLQDMLVSSCEMAYPEGVTDSTTWLYLNTGTSQQAQFTLQDKGFMFGSMLDFGREAHPALVDFDGDGLLDIVVGNSYNTQNNRSTRAALFLLRNTGTTNAPAFEQVSNDVAGLAALNIPCLYPTFGDLDGDGDLDLLVGTNNGTLIYAENTAGAGQAMAFGTPQNNFAGISAFGSFVAPQLYDIDGDGDLDIIAGENSGNLNLFENKGNAQAYSFQASPTSSQFGRIALNVSGSRRSVPLFYRNSQTQETELLLGHEFGNIIRFGNIDGNLGGSFDSLDTNFEQIYIGKYAAPAFGDLDGDGKPDLVLGNVRGGISFFMSSADTVETTIIDWSADLDRRVSVFPNPTEDFTTVRFSGSSRLNTRVNIFTSVGFLMQTYLFPGTETSCQLDLRRLKEGTYIIEVWSNGRRTTHRVVVLPH